MNVNGTPYRTIWLENGKTVQIIDQRHLPHRFIVEDINTVEQMATAIREMHVRGAGLIGAAAGYGMYLATLEQANSDDFLSAITSAGEQLMQTRPTAVNLEWAVKRQLRWRLVAKMPLVLKKKLPLQKPLHRSHRK